MRFVRLSAVETFFKIIDIKRPFDCAQGDNLPKTLTINSLEVELKLSGFLNPTGLNAITPNP